MTDFELDAELATVNPIEEETLVGVIPPGLGEAMLREIIVTGSPAVGQRLADAFAGFRPRTWGRTGFVGVVAVVALAVLAVNVTSFGRASDDMTGPSGLAPSQQVGEPRPTSGNDQAPGPSPAPPTQPSPAPSSNSPSSAPSDSSSDPASTSTALTDPTPTTAPPVTAAPTASTVPQATAPCTATGDSLGKAMSAYAESCTAPRVDCDPADGLWVCSSELIGGDGPGGSSTPTPGPDQTTPALVGSNCVSIEAESLQLVGAWNRKSDAGASGGAYITWEGLSRERNNSSPADVINATINITNPGSYRVVWSMRQPGDVAGDKANDSWLNFADAARFGPAGDGSYDGFVKVYGYGKGSFAWAAKADQHEKKTDMAIEFSRAGNYTMQLAGRSHGHQIDKIVIYRDTVSRDDALNGRCGGSN